MNAQTANESKEEQNKRLALLTAQSIAVYHETGLTPRQLADQRAELLDVCQRVFEYAAPVAADGDMDEEAKPLYEALRAAIVRVEE